MPALKCTAKLAKLGGLELAKPTEDSRDDWHANIFRFRRKNHVLFCHDKSRLACLSAPVRKKDVSQLSGVLRESLLPVLVSEQFSETAISACLSRVEDLKLTKTNNRSVLGNLNEFSQHLEWYAAYDGIEDSELVRSLIWRVNNMPLVGPLDGQYAINVYKRGILHAV